MEQLSNDIGGFSGSAEDFMETGGLRNGTRRVQVNNGHKGSDNDGRWERGIYSHRFQITRCGE